MIKRLTKKLSDINNLKQLESGSHGLVANVVDDETMLDKVKRLHASVYLDLGFIDEHELNHKGQIGIASDPHQKHATYFYVSKKSDPSDVVAIARQINTTTVGLDSLPVFSKTKVDHSRRMHFYDVHEDGRAVEVSALIKKPGASSLAPIILYKYMLDYSRTKGHTLWFMALDTNVYRKVHYQFGSLIHPIGEIAHFKGGDAMPLVMHIDQLPEQLYRQLNESKYLQKIIRTRLYDFFVGDKSEEYDISHKK